MKKWIAFLSGCLCYMFCVLPVQADVIWEPLDSFYEKHSSECEYVSRTFTANGPDGEVIVYESPVSGREVARWENGFKAYISFTYEDENGVVWGIYEEQGSKTGWMPMEYMDVVYDAISFAEEYEADITAESGALDEQYLGESVRFWRYPGATEGYEATVESYVPEYHGIYVDSQGHRWGNVGYYFARRNFWICLDQPGADFDTLYPDGTSGIGVTQPEEKDFPAERIVPGGGQNKLILIAIPLVILVTGVAIVILRREYKKRNNE
ncbi:MAG: hypothetical protein K2O32_03010 [Acetatifactor sp.]|nr:hypothetical protein [Acetatifactor sp.]